MKTMMMFDVILENETHDEIITTITEVNVKKAMLEFCKMVMEGGERFGNHLIMSGDRYYFKPIKMIKY